MNDAIAIDFSKGIDLSISMHPRENAVLAWYAAPLKITPVSGEGFIGAVAQGGSVNFRDIFFNPHAHGTHTECLGHITEKVVNLNEVAKPGMFKALLISITPEKKAGDSVIGLQQLKDAIGEAKPQAVVLRTLPNENTKLSTNYSNSNPTYLDHKAAEWLREMGVLHLLIDTPSVDREEDGGALKAHHAFWNVPDNPRMSATITELIFVPNHVLDGEYMLHLSWANFENDACPSRPLLYPFIA